jgi:diguanylate cyclase (GGDEF)-like protein
MNDQSIELRRRLAVWRQEDVSVTDDAAAINLTRFRWLLPLVVGINALHAAAFLFQWLTTGETGLVRQWMFSLALAHVLMGCAMAGLAFVAHRLRFASRSPWGKALTLLIVALAMVFQISVAAIDQWVTPNITPFLIGCIIVSLVVYLRPVVSVVVFSITYLGFYAAIGLTQSNLALLLSNRLNGFAACVLGWCLSVLLWRKFATITLQQALLEKSNTDLQLKQRDLERLTRLDGLTGLYNRNTFVELTQLELDRAQRQNSATAILLLDLDHFKRVNDTWGHPAGDAVLKHVARVAKETVRSTDLVGRLGGEEFIVLLPNTTLEAARKLAEKLRSRMEASPTTWETISIAATASIGLAGTTSAEKRDFESLYNSADKALYQAKQRGRNQVV